MKLLLTTITTDNKKSDLELRYLYSVLADAPIELEMKKYGRYETCADIYEDIMQGLYDLVYFHTDSENILSISSVAQMVKKASLETGIMLGGMEVSFETHDFMRDHPYVDYVVRGEGETVMYNFVRGLLQLNYNFATMAGLAYRTEEGIKVNPFDDPIEMNELPFPYDKTESGRGTVYYESIRGTSDRSIHRQYLPDPRVRSLSINRVCTELRYFLVKDVERVVFFDQWFNFNTERAYRIFEYIINNDNGVTSFEFNMNGDKLDDDIIRLLSDARDGLFTLNIDIGSTNAEVLGAMGRRENVYQLMYNVTKLMRESNVSINIFIASGLPYETETMFARSFNKSYGLAAGMPLHIQQLYADKGTTLRKQAERYGYIHSEVAPYEVISSGHMSSSQILRIKKITRVVDAFIGDGGFKNSVPRILNDTGIRPYELFKSLSIYIGEEELENKMVRKENQARILYSFAEQLYRELGDAGKLEMLQDVIQQDLEAMISVEDIKRFERQGWELNRRDDD